MALLLGDTVPDFKAESSDGSFRFFDFLDTSWAIFVSHPGAFMPVCTSDMSRLQKLAPEFQKRGVKIVALTCDSNESNQGWVKDIMFFTDGKFSFPIVADPKRSVAHKFGMILNTDDKGVPPTVRSVFIIDPGKKLRLSLTYPTSTGLNFDEILRVIDSLQLVDSHKVVTPNGWKPNDKCLILPSLGEREADKLFPKGVNTLELPSGKSYFRLTPQP